MTVGRIFTKNIYLYKIIEYSSSKIKVELYCTFCILGIFFENRKNSGLTPGQNDDPVTRTWKVTQMTHWPNDPVPCLHISACNEINNTLFSFLYTSAVTTVTVRHCARICCWAPVLQQSIDNRHLLQRRAAAERWDGRTDRRDALQFHRPCSVNRRPRWNQLQALGRGKLHTIQFNMPV